MPAQCQHGSVPEGHCDKIAQRFNVGVGVTCGESPEGTADGFDMLFQSSLRDSMFVVTKSPKVKTLGLFSRIPPGSKPIFNNPSGIKIKTPGINQDLSEMPAQCRHDSVPEGHATNSPTFQRWGRRDVW